MIRFWKTVIRLRLVFASLSLVALLVTLWLRSSPVPAAAPTKAVNMSVETAIVLGNSITEPASTGEDLSEQARHSASSGAYRAAPLPRTSTVQGDSFVSTGVNTTVREAMAAPSVKSQPVSSFETSNPYTSPQNGLLNGTAQQGGGPGESF